MTGQSSILHFEAVITVRLIHGDRANTSAFSLRANFSENRW